MNNNLLICKRIMFASLLIAVALLASCPMPEEPDPTPAPPNPAPPAPATPPTPANLTSTARDTAVTLTWTTATGAQSYRVYRDDTLIETPHRITDTAYTDNTVTNGTPYSYTVRALNSAGAESPHSNPVTANPGTPPAAPRNLRVTLENGNVTLTWDMIANATYHIYRNRRRLETADPITNPPFTDTGLNNNIKYRYTVRAIDNNRRESINSNEVVSVPPDAPQNLMLTPRDREITLTWPAVTDAVIYRIYRDSAETPIETADSTYTDTGLDNGTDYSYIVRAVDSSGLVSAGSTTETASPSLPTGNFTTLTAAGNNFPGGIWSDGTTMWVVQRFTNKTFAYNMYTKERDETKEFDLHANNTDPRGIWGSDGTIWVADGQGRGGIYVYNLTDGAYMWVFTFPRLNSANNDPRGLWSDGTTLWVSNGNADDLFAYNFHSGVYDGTQNFTGLHPGGSNFYGIWGNADTIWFANYGDDLAINAYHRADAMRGTPDTARSITTATLTNNGNTRPFDLWSNGTTLWVSDFDTTIYAYDLATGEAAP